MAPCWLRRCAKVEPPSTARPTTREDRHERDREQDQDLPSLAATLVAVDPERVADLLSFDLRAAVRDELDRSEQR